MATGETVRVSVDSAGSQANGDSTRVSLGTDGRVVCFTSWATNLVAGDTNGLPDVFVRDRTAGSTERVSVSSDEIQGDGWSDRASLSADGRYVAFDSGAADLVSGDTNGAWDVFVRDRQAGTTERASVDSAEIQADGGGGHPALSADGRYVAFESRSADLVGDDSNGAWDVFVRDRQAGTTERVSVSIGGAEGDDDSDSASISADGRYVAFVSQATDLAPGDRNGMGDVFVRDRTMGTTQRVSVSTTGVQGYDDSDSPAFSAGSAYVAFESWANNLVGSDTNGCADVLVGEVVEVPTVTGLSKARGSVTGGSTVVITGTAFAGATSVTFGGAAAAFTIDSPTQITATAPAHAEGTVQVQVIARGVPTEDTAADDFAYSPATLYQQTETRLTYLGPWQYAAQAPASGGSFYHTSGPGTALTVSFEGSRLIWVAKTGPQYGQATVSLDGGGPFTVDLYSALYLYQQGVYDTGPLTDGAHTLTIRWAATKNAASTGYLVNIDAFEVMGTLTQAPVATRYQQNDTHLSYAGGWLAYLSGYASGGSFDYANSSGAAVNVSFQGTYLAWIAKTGPQYGKARVSLDGGDAFTVDLYSPTAYYKRCVYSTGLLEDTGHTLGITWTGTKNSASTSYLVDVDAVDVMGSLTPAPPPPPVPSLYQQSDARIAHLGSWSYAAQTPASGGSFHHTTSAGAGVIVSFTGTSVALLAKTAANYGKALVRLDGGTAEPVDLYSSKALYQQVVYEKQGLDNAAHTLTIEYAGLKNTASAGYLINVDALRVVGSLTQAPRLVRYQQTDAHLAYSGAWYSSSSAWASGGDFAFINSAGSVTVTWTGPYLAWIGKLGPQYGIAKLTLDGGTPVYVDLYKSVGIQQQRIYNTGFLANTPHTLIIEWNGTKNSASTSYVVGVDALDTAGALQ